MMWNYVFFDFRTRTVTKLFQMKMEFIRKSAEKRFRKFGKFLHFEDNTLDYAVVVRLKYFKVFIHFGYIMLMVEIN